MTAEAPQRRAIRSFVRREGRITAAQQRALDELLPRYALDVSAPLDLRAAFGRAAPVYLEIGSGNGDCLLACAARNPDNDYLAVEVHRPGVGHLLNGATAAALDNLRVCVSDVHLVLAQLPAECLLGVYIFFPDPWPKLRHHKRRLVRPPLWQALHRCLQRHGRVYLATDSDSYAEDIAAQLPTLDGWRNLAARGVYAPRLKARIRTRFEGRALAAGRTIHDFALARAR